jgi:multidrug efflux pump subunit AcrB
MWIVKLALDRPYTFIVASILILSFGLSAIVTMPADIFPHIDIPIITVVYDYRGLPAEELEQRITTFNEFITSTVNDVKSVDSQTIRGYAMLMIYSSRKSISIRRWPRWELPCSRFASDSRVE